MDKIKFVNSGQPAVNDTNLNKMQDNIEAAISGDMVTAYHDGGNVSLNAEYATLNFNKIVGGKNLTLKNNRVYVGKGISKVRVNATAFLENFDNSIEYIMFSILKNGQAICNAVDSGTKYYQSISITDAVIDVQENDYLQLQFNNPSYSSHAVTIRGNYDTRLFVEAVG